MVRALYKVLAWSLQALAEGKWPTADHEGKPIPAQSSHHRPSEHSNLTSDGLRGIYYCTTGDWRWTKDEFELKQNWCTNEVCHRCYVSCHVGPSSWTVLDPSNPSFLQRRTNDEFMEPATPIMAIHGMHLDTVKIDWVHASLLGTEPVAVGAALDELCDEKAFGNGGNMRAWRPRMNMQLRVAQARFKKWSKGR